MLCCDCVLHRPALSNSIGQCRFYIKLMGSTELELRERLSAMVVAAEQSSDDSVVADESNVKVCAQYTFIVLIAYSYLGLPMVYDRTCSAYFCILLTMLSVLRSMGARLHSRHGT